MIRVRGAREVIFALAVARPLPVRAALVYLGARNDERRAENDERSVEDIIAMFRGDD